MIGTRYESYESKTGLLPFVLKTDIRRTPFNLSREQNWHEELELQLCTDGEGEVLINGEKYAFRKNDIVIVNSNIIHYTYTGSSLTYSCLIVSTAFCSQIGIDCDLLSFSPHVKSPVLVDLFLLLAAIYAEDQSPLRTARLYQALLSLLIELGANHAVPKQNTAPNSRAFAAVKETVTYIHRHYDQKITLDALSKHVMLDKYALCREFKKVTGQTIFENLSKYRCLRASEHLKNGCSVSEAAALCGFENLSFFTKTFKKHIGQLPSSYRKR